MYCPRCSQQQVSHDIRFCSRCGFPLSSVAELLASGGIAAASDAPATDAVLSPRQKGVRRGAMIMFGAVALFFPVILLTLIEEDFVALLAFVALIFIAGLMRSLYARLFQSDAPRKAKGLASGQTENYPPVPVASAARGTELPPLRSVPVPSFTSYPHDTAEMAQPPSVTESTTRLLEDETGGKRG